MFTGRNSLKAVFLSATICLLIVSAAAGRSQRAVQQRSQRQSAATQRLAANRARTQAKKQAAQQRQTQQRVAAAQQRNQRQVAATERKAANQARTEANKQAVRQQQAARQVAAVQQRTQRQAAARERQATNQARTEADKRAVQRQQVERRTADVNRRTDRQTAVEQSRAPTQVRIERDRRTPGRTQPAQPVTVTRNTANTETRVERDVRTTGDRARTVITRDGDHRSAARDDRRSGLSRNVARHSSTSGFNRVRTTRAVYPRRDAFSSRVRWRTTRNRGHRSRVFTHIVWPSYGYPVYYRHGPDLFVSYYRPSFHRKYVFFSIGNFWPVSYTYARYYWYGWYPYNWYGCYPTATVYTTPGDTYNYYTYNTYSYDSDTGAADTPTEYAPPLEGVDENTFADIREKLAAQAEQEPDSATLTDKLFEEGVNAFEQGDYDSAARSFADAVAFEPDDLILPFAYVQALFASGQYSKAADVLRDAVEQMPADQQGLFFPRGLYSDDEIFFAQINQLRNTAAVADDADVSVLLAYQLIGAESYDEARDWLSRAADYDVNQSTATILVDLLNKVEEQSQEDSQST